MSIKKCMGRFCSFGAWLAIAAFALLNLAGCGSTKPGPPLFPGKINLTPVNATSLTLGGVLGFTASAQTPSGTTLSVPITYTSSDTSILNLSPNGVACAGHWDGAFTTCTPGGVGPVTVTASALGKDSVPTYVFVHPPIDNITVNGIVVNGKAVQEPCLSQTQSMTVEAHAYSQGSDITASVGPFTWTASNTAVVGLVPLPNTTFLPGTNVTYNFATNQATATAAAPGITYIYASASGVSSTSFLQPQITSAQGSAAPPLDFFSTCPIQNIALELGAVGSGRTTLSAAKGTSSSQTAFATVVDVMGNSSLPNTDNGVVLSKTPLTWTSSQSTAISTASSCTLSCALSTPSAGSATITASCSPPTCNIGYPLVPATLATPAQVGACTTFFHALYPNFVSCQELIPTPVYASPVFITPPNTPSPLTPVAALSGVVTGAPAAAAILASSNGCALEIPSACTTSAYFFSTAKASVGSETPLPASPNSLLFSPAGDKVFMGSRYGAALINPANFGTANSPFTSLGTVTGTALAVSQNGANAIFSDTVHQPNQVYVVSSNSPSAPTALNIPSASLAAFSPDGLKTYIIGGAGANSMYIYSPVQALQGPITLAGAPTALAFSPNGAFLFAAESGSSPNLTAFANCSNPALGPIQPATSIALPASPLFMKILPALPIDAKDSFGNTIPNGVHILILDSTGFDIVTAQISPPAVPGTLCPQGLTFVTGDPLGKVERIELGQGTMKPLNFFYSADDTQLYVVSSDTSSIVVYSFITGSVIGGIQLQNNATPLTADISADSGTIVISGSDGMVHEVSTIFGGSDAVPLSFPDIPNFPNPFCSADPSAGPCTLSFAIVKP